MTWNPYPPLPLSAVRDLHGITRAMYRAALDDQPRDEARLGALATIGRTLRAVLHESGAPPGTIPHGEAWAAAERATKELRELVRATPLAPLVEATARLVTRSGSGSMV